MSLIIEKNELYRRQTGTSSALVLPGEEIEIDGVIYECVTTTLSSKREEYLLKSFSGKVLKIALGGRD